MQFKGKLIGHGFVIYIIIKYKTESKFVKACEVTKTPMCSFLDPVIIIKKPNPTIIGMPIS